MLVSLHRSVFTAIIAAMLVGLSGCTSDAKSDLALTATVYNAVSKEPFEGAMVVGIYKQCGGNFAVSACWCVRTAAVRTGKDGVFTFPVTKTEGIPRLAVFAPGHYLKYAELPSPEAQRKQDKSYYANWDLWLAPQDPENPDFRYQSENNLPCQRASSLADARAGEEFETATNTDRAKLLQVVVDNARQNNAPDPEKNGAIARMESTIDVIRLGEAGARAKAQMAMQSRSMSSGCAGKAKPEDFPCCYGFADRSRTPLFAEILKKEKIDFKLEKNSVCVHQGGSAKVDALQLTTP